MSQCVDGRFLPMGMADGHPDEGWLMSPHANPNPNPNPDPNLNPNLMRDRVKVFKKFFLD